MRLAALIPCLLLISIPVLANTSAAQAPSYICVEAETGLVVHEENADAVRPPASMLKLMLMLLVCEGIEAGKWHDDTPVTASAEAQRMGGTQVYLEAGDTWPLAHLMRAVGVASANDAAMAVAEGLWDSKEACIEAMNLRAWELGMVQTKFTSVHGLPPDPGVLPDATTARDFSILARACIARPRIREWVGDKEFQFRPEQAVIYNTNKLLWRMEGCDGLKTGYIRAAGFCIAATASRDGLRLVAVVMGEAGSNDRFRKAEALLSEGLEQVRRVRLAEAGQMLQSPLPAMRAMTSSVRLEVSAPLNVVVKAEDADAVTLAADHPRAVEAPLQRGTVVGEIRAELGGRVLAKAPLAIAEDLLLDAWRLVTDPPDAVRAGSAGFGGAAH
jgi:D-alanyl-D-alanine carboxypeptidase (penicillin-binding protein 5/6)